MLILINAISSFLGAMIGVLAYMLASRKINLKETPPNSFNQYQQLAEPPTTPLVKKKRRTSDEIALENEKRELLQKNQTPFIDQMTERVTMVKE